MVLPFGIAVENGPEDTLSSMNTFGAAWFTMAIAFSFHVIDEAATDFLAWYNPMARRIQERIRIPFPPTFTFWPWFLGLLAVSIILIDLTPLAAAYDRRVVLLAIFVAIINIGNGLLHIGAAIRLGRRVPGVISAPFLLASATWLLISALRSL
jgi:hypothetical protein